MTRTQLFERLRPLMPDQRFSQAAVTVVDGIADEFGLPRAASPAATSNPPIPDDYWPMLAQIESNNRPYIKAPTSSGSGLYQFIKATWLGEGGQWGNDPKQAFGGLKPTVEEQTARARSFTARNATYLLRNGVKINKATLYAAHFFGPQTAAKVLAAADGSRADLLAGQAATQANSSILQGKTVGEFKAWLRKKTGDVA